MCWRRKVTRRKKIRTEELSESSGNDVEGRRADTAESNLWLCVRKEGVSNLEIGLTSLCRSFSCKRYSDQNTEKDTIWTFWYSDNFFFGFQKTNKWLYPLAYPNSFPPLLPSQFSLLYRFRSKQKRVHSVVYFVCRPTSRQSHRYIETNWNEQETNRKDGQYNMFYCFPMAEPPRISVFWTDWIR